MRKSFRFGLGVSVVFAVACGSNNSETPALSSTTKAPLAPTGKVVATASASASASARVVPPLKKGQLPMGPTLVVEAAKKGDHTSDTGVDVSLVMSATDDPMMAYVDTSADDKLSVKFIAWDRDAGKWKGPIQVDTITTAPRFENDIEIARDKSTSALGIVYRKTDNEAWVAFSSDSGSTWKPEKLATTKAIAGVSLALAKGGQFIAINDGDDAKVFSRFAATGDFKSDTAPVLADAAHSKGGDLSIKVDSDGKPGLLYGLDPKTAYNTLIAFWRPGDPSAFKVTDSNNIQNDSIHLSLAFAGTKPRAAVTIGRGGGEKSTNYFVTSDDGKEWAAPINVPPDGGQATQGALSLAVTEAALPRPEVAAIAMHTTGGNLTGTTCGDPKLARTNDLKSFTTCSPDIDRSLEVTSSWSSAAFDDKGKLYIAFTNTVASAKIPIGLFVWHE